MEDIIIIQADKGGKIVIMDRTQYISNIKQKLQDQEIYEEVNNPINIVKTKISEITEKLFKQNKISQRMKMEFHAIEDLPKIRGQPKIHKINHLMRLITCIRNTILSNISRYILNIIKDLRKAIKHNVINTEQPINRISGIKIQKREHLAGLDIQDMYTNIPVTRATDIIINRIKESDTFIKIPITQTDLKKLLLLTLNNNYVQFNNKHYKQKQVLPMVVAYHQL